MTASIQDFRQVLTDLSTLTSRPILIGRMAMVVFGSDQLTRDMDLVAPDFPEVIEVLYRNGFRVISGKAIGADGSISFELFDSPAAAKYAIGLRAKIALRSLNPVTRAELDIWLEPKVPYETLLADSREVDLGGLKLRVPSAKHMIRLKEFAIEDNPARKVKDQWDIDFLRGLEKKSATD